MLPTHALELSASDQDKNERREKKTKQKCLTSGIEPGNFSHLGKYYQQFNHGDATLLQQKKLSGSFINEKKDQDRNVGPSVFVAVNGMSLEAVPVLTPQYSTV